MKILGIDTTSNFLILGAYDNGKIYDYNLELGRKHSALLIVTIERLLKALGWKPQDLDYFACGVGPGSFTGIRIGLAVIKGLAWAIKKPVIGVATLDVLARNAKATNGFIIPIIDAKRNLIYCSIYKTEDKRIQRIAPYMLLTEGEFFKKAKNRAIILGDALDLYREKILKKIKGATILDKDYWRLRGHHIMEVALEKIMAGKINTAFDLKPLYLYPKECQICVSTDRLGQR